MSDFSEGFDPLFYGFSTGYGTWFQGEVAGNYAGPFNSNATISHLHLRLYPNESWTLGALFYDFDSDNSDLGDLDGRELDLFLAWGGKNGLTVSPLLGFYQPRESAERGGVQIGNDDLSIYAQLILSVTF